jgi:hypothetical protein
LHVVNFRLRRVMSLFVRGDVDLQRIGHIHRLFDRGHLRYEHTANMYRDVLLGGERARTLLRVLVRIQCCVRASAVPA